MKGEFVPTPGRAEAAASIWDWRHRQIAAAPEISASRARIRGAIQGLTGVAAGGLIFASASTTLGTVVLGIAGLILLAALISPTGLYAGIALGLEALGHFVRRAMTWVLMPLIFYMIFLPFGLLFRRGHKDPMRRFYDPNAATYWSPRKDQGPSLSLKRQF